MEEKAYSMDRSAFAPLSFWAWNGEMDAVSIRKRIEEYKEQGFGGFFMHSRAGLLTPYFSEEWFEACRTAADLASEYGMKAWIYDEDGWPSGFAGGRVNGLGETYQAKHMEQVTTLEERDEGHILGCYRTNAAEGRSYQSCSREEAEWYLVYRVEPDYVDLLSHQVVEAFIQSTYERYRIEMGERLGTVIPGFFTDEPQYFHQGMPYSLELSAYFMQKKGYDLIDCLPLLFSDQNIDQVKQARLDYWDVVESMMRENFSKQIYDWCEQYQVQFTGHYPGEDSLIFQLDSTGGVMPKYQYMQMPGIDHLGRRITPILLTKQVTSASKQCGRKKIISETFGCAGWNISFEEMCRIWGWQALAGINVPCLHIGTHSIRGIRKRDYPAFYSYQEPWWSQFHHVSKWMQGIGYYMNLGKWTEDVLVISPIKSLSRYHSVTHQQKEEELAASYRCLLDHLLDIQVGFDLGDEEILKDSGSLTGNQIQVGNCAYRIVVVAQMEYLETSTQQLLGQFMEQGGTVVCCNSKPEVLEDSLLSKVPVIANSRRFWYKYFESIGYQRPVTVYEKTGFHIMKDLAVSVKEDQGIRYVYLWNAAAESERECLISIPYSGWNSGAAPMGESINEPIAECKQACSKRQSGIRSRISRIDPETGQESKLNALKAANSNLLPLIIHGNETILLKIDTREETEVGAEAGEEIRSEIGEATRLERCPDTTEELSFQPISVQKEYPQLQPYRCQDNALTIDYAAYSLDGIHFTEAMPMVKMHAQLYQDLEQQKSSRIYVRYTFENTCKVDAAAIGWKLAVEDKDCIRVSLNGIPVSTVNDWFVDQDIHIYNIASAVISGENTIELVYQLPDYSIKNVDESFETERNRFFYPVEPEAVYLLGDFNTCPRNSYTYERNYIRTPASGFAIADSKPLHNLEDMTTQGMWFYRGNAAANFSIDRSSKQKIAIRLYGLKAACAEVTTDKGSRLLYLSPFQADLTDLLEEGENTVTLTLYGTNRNLLGPHHHCKGENHYVGPNTFQGVKGYEDKIVNYDIHDSNTWTDAYAFEPFGCSRVEIIRTTHECSIQLIPLNNQN